MDIKTCLVVIFLAFPVLGQDWPMYGWYKLYLRNWKKFTPMIVHHGPEATETPKWIDSFPEQYGDVEGEEAPKWFQTFPIPSIQPSLFPKTVQPKLKLKNSKKDPFPKEPLNITVERYGGFGGSGDSEGQGAYIPKLGKKPDIGPEVFGLPTPFPERIYPRPKIRNPLVTYELPPLLPDIE